ncbi:gliding motility lipoprotein GldJ [Mucilaginibacter sp. PPCGB 2223]|nr:SUMF1/EgtB/PvdO family nonheme iron enzyme [Mucilaginibacter sp. PPCGB 2223]OCX51260.1 gliding motility lipoprotein GldJ [Mucilaginibacter sp. PPCGB 2223]
MKRIFTRSVLPLMMLVLALASCKNAPKSQKTGMKYNDKTNGGFQVFKKTHPAPGPGLVPIEGGTFVMGGSLDQDVQFDYTFARARVPISSFYMDETEVSNNDWLEYLHWLSINFPTDRELYYNALPDTLVWRSALSANEPYVNNYLRHPSFQDYPVVGVSWEQANDYCVWRTDRMNENILRETGRLADWKTASNDGKKVPQLKKGEPFNTEIYLNGQNKGNGIDGKNMMPNLSPTAKVGANGKATRPVRLEDGIITQEGYRLPTEAEWEYAALGLVGNTENENISEGKMYPWNGMGVRSPKSGTRGLILANFKRGKGDYMGVAGSLNDKADITAPVRSYLPNDFGLYNMAGNVNEWTSDTYRQLSYEDFEGLNPYRGNQFTEKRMADASKGVLAKDKYGKAIHDPAKTDKKMSYADYLASQAAGANSGATNTNKAPANGAAPTGAPAPGNKYAPNTSLEGKPYTPDERGYNDTVNTVLYGRTTLINDRSKVYKGGSWNDMAYWLNPSTRRFMDQADASADIGFRCAMTNIGPAEIFPSGKSHFPVKKPKDFKPH